MPAPPAPQPAPSAPASAVPEQPKPEPSKPEEPKLEPPKAEPPAAAKPEEAKPVETAPKVEEKPALAPPSESKPAEKPAENQPAAESKPATEAKPAEKPAETAAARPPAGAIDAKISSYAPAAELVAQVDDYIKEIEEGVKTEKDFNDNKEAVNRDANTLIPLALALGLHDTDNKYKTAAPAILDAAKKLAAAKEYAEVKAAADDLKKALNSNGNSAALKWEDGMSASLPALMKEVPLINTKLRSNARDERRLKRGAEKVASYAAVIAVIAQGSIPDAAQTEKPNEVDQWQAFCLQMRDAAGDVNAKVKDFTKDPSKEKFQAVEAAMKALTPTSCDACHTVFHPSEVGKVQD